MTDKRKGELMMVICGVLWSMSGITMKYINWNPLLIVGGRGIFSAVIIYISMKMSGYKLKVSKKSLGIAFLTFMNLVCFVSANKYTTAANAIVLQYTAPVFVLIVTAFILKRKLKIYEIVTVFAALFGIVLFFMDQVSGNGMFGNILAVTSGFFMGIMYALTGEIKDDGERISGLVLGHTALAIICVPLGWIFTDPAEITLIPILLVVFLGVVQMGIPYSLYGRATALISGVEVSLISMIEPILNPIWVALIYGEIPGSRALVGAALIIGAVICYTIIDAKEPALKADNNNNQ
ncbi:MAG: DMT family transporter [Firmicutes bacterium]|nr:DMT family transporter [Bacillota bacterium]